MNWAPSAGQDVLARRAELLARARQFFSDRGLLEVQTPVLVSSSCPDPNIPSIVARPHAAGPLFLHTSPEHAMKRLLCAGSGDIFQICPVFRDGEAGQYHNPEFTMIEWYRLGYDHHAMAAETATLIQTLLNSQSEPVSISYREAFGRYAGIDPFTAETATLADVCQRNGIAPPELLREDRDAWLDLLMGAVVAPALRPDRIHVLYDYPGSQAALARIRPETPPVAERFEIFHGGLELANGFHELADAAEQRQRFVAEQARYTDTGRTIPPLDEHLLAALENGLPDCSGVALGFDRLLMLATGKTRLADVIAFPFERI